MPRERTLQELTLTRAWAEGKPGWVRARWERSGGQRGQLFAYFRRKTRDSWYVATITMDVPTAAVLRDVPLARIEAAANTDPEIRAWIEQAEELKMRVDRQRMRERHRLEPPTGRKLDDSFYQDVARAYAQAVVYGLPPAKTLAEDSGIPPGTVNRWIRRARDRGFLPPTTPGKMSQGLPKKAARAREVIA